MFSTYKRTWARQGSAEDWEQGETFPYIRRGGLLLVSLLSSFPFLLPFFLTPPRPCERDIFGFVCVSVCGVGVTPHLHTFTSVCTHRSQGLALPGSLILLQLLKNFCMDTMCVSGSVGLCVCVSVYEYRHTLQRVRGGQKGCLGCWFSPAILCETGSSCPTGVYTRLLLRDLLSPPHISPTGALEYRCAQCR